MKLLSYEENLLRNTIRKTWRIFTTSSFHSKPVVIDANLVVIIYTSKLKYDSMDFLAVVGLIRDLTRTL